MKSLILLIILTSLFSSSQLLTAQTSLGSWNIITLKMPLRQKWALFGEAQIRSLKFYSNFHYYEYKAGVQYKLHKQLTIAIGVGNFDTYASGDNFKTPIVNDETRTWMQLTMNQPLQRLKMEHRYRAEQRWTSNGFRNRFRYRLGITLPIQKQIVEPAGFYAYAWNELFFTNTAPYFERNRVSAGMGHTFRTPFSVQLGWVNQFDYRINDETGRNFLQLSLLFNILLKKSSNEKTPGAVE
jgi:Protein of unknown function (DUF2490)